MNKRQLFELTRINLRYANPQATEKARKRGKNGTALTRSLVNQYLLFGLLFLVIYGSTLFTIDLSKLPGFFTYYIALFCILAFSQGVSVIYNVFFESQDLTAYLPLPFQQTTIFLAKILVVCATVVPFVLPMLVVFFLTSWRSGLFLPYALLSAVILFLLVITVVFAVCCLIVFGLTRTAFFKAHKKLVTSFLLIVSMLVSIIGILVINNQQSESMATSFDRSPIALFMPLFHIATAPISTIGFFSFLGLLLLLTALLVIIRLVIIPKLYEQLAGASSAQESTKRKHKNQQSFHQMIRNYHIQLIKDPNLLMQVVSSSLLMPIIFIITFAISGSLDLSQLDYHFIGVVFLAGIALSTLTVNQASFIGNFISLDRENFPFICSLPLSLSDYLHQKFRFALVLQLILTGIIALTGGIAFHMPILFLLVLLLGTALGTYILCLHYFARDYRLLLLDWTTIQQLLARGSGNIGLGLTLLVSMVISLLVLVGYGIAALHFSFWPLNISVFSVILLFSILSFRHYQKHFWHLFT